MRNLTIKRHKSFVASLGTMKVYIEDPEGDLQINGVNCRKLGNLKNGQEVTFSISEQAAKLFVIADKLSKNYCSESLQLPAGTEDISLSGKNHYNPFAGNPFYFDGVADEQTIANRKNGKKKGTVVLIAAVVVGLLVGILGSLDFAAEPKTFTTAGMQITLTDEFRESKQEGFTMCYGSKDMAVFVIKEVFALAEGFEKYTVEEYGDLLLQANGMTGIVQIQRDGDLLFFEFSDTNPDSGEKFHYICYFFKASDAFWSIQFATHTEDLATQRPAIIDYAKSIQFIQ